MFLQKLKRWLPEGKTLLKAKKERRRLPKARVAGKKTRLFIWICIGLMGFSGTFAYLKAMRIDGEVIRQEKYIQELNGKQQTDPNLLSPRLTVFLDRFVPLYINIPAEQAGQEKRSKELTKYYAQGLKDTVEATAGYRELKEKRFWDVIQNDGRSIVQYKVTYLNVSKAGEGEETAAEEKKEEVSALLNIPVQASSSGYAVVEQVYMTAIPTLHTSEFAAVKSEWENKEQVKAEVKNDVERWLQEFFRKYASSSSQDMAYMMDVPEGLDGLKEFKEVKARVYDSEGKWFVQAEVVFKETTVDILDTEHFTLLLEKKEDKYHVKKMKHTLGGL
ncbi:conjugal transfer protein [Paenibacillus larvae]|uniref:conjugal transfer protein n=1 Tax=Paenibacillus larvae TaxID=1464 RepID=UPI0022818821|nr:conjugal transfer protein [Paenibacillus larvae]MCY9500077.1 conjugal transfer protein [Paenibacillus larvae]